MQQKYITNVQIHSMFFSVLIAIIQRKISGLYVLDGDVAFGMAASIARYLQIGDNIPELIIVGIGYGALDESAGEKRRRDYRPTQAGCKILNFWKMN
jgi:hypothetical protein